MKNFSLFSTSVTNEYISLANSYTITFSFLVISKHKMKISNKVAKFQSAGNQRYTKSFIQIRGKSYLVGTSETTRTTFKDQNTANIYG